MTKGTILYIGGFELPDKNAAAHRVLSNAKIFRELGYNVVFLGVDKELGFYENILHTKKSIQGFDCWSYPYPKSMVQWLFYLTSIVHVKKILKRYTDIRIVIAYNYQSIALSKLKTYSLQNKIKLIGDCTEWYSTKGSGTIFKILKGIDTYFRMCFIHKRLDGLIVISKYLEEHYRHCENLIRIPPLVDKRESKWINTKSNNGDSKKRLVYAGNLGVNKDFLRPILDTLLTLEKLPPFSLYIIGVNKTEFLKNHPINKGFVEKLHNKVHFTGKLSHLEALEYVKMADFTIFLREDNRLTKAGFPTKFTESVSCGTPVITSITSDISEYLKEEQYGFFLDNKKIELSIIKAFHYMTRYNELSKLKPIDVDIFDYRRYIDEMACFIDKLTHKFGN